MTSPPQKRGRPPPWPRNSKNGQFKRGKGRVICTHLVKVGLLDRRLWELDVEFTATRLSPSVVRGYHCWAIPYVRLMRRNKWAERLMLPLARWRAEEIAFQLGERRRPNYLGKAVRLLGEPFCWFVGVLPALGAGGPERTVGREA